jgi:Fe-S-cluster-containing dehydrogenase component
MTRYGLLIDLELCTGCKACMTVCKGNHDIPYGEYEGREYYRLWPVEKEVGIYPYVIRNLTPWLCMQCADPPCVKRCPIPGAIRQRDDGIVVVDESLCDGCRQCLMACPYGALYFRQDKGVVDKCDLCVENIDEGTMPECVKACPSEAIVFGDIEDPNSQLSRLILQKQAMPLHPEYDTYPAVYYTSHASRLRGTVINAASGQPITGADIMLESEEIPPVLLRTDANGIFFAWSLRNSTHYRIKVAATGFHSYFSEITVAGDYQDLGILQLNKKS